MKDALGEFEAEVTRLEPGTIIFHIESLHCPLSDLLTVFLHFLSVLGFFSFAK